MKVLLWNCKNGIASASKISYFNSFSADIAIVPELIEKHIKFLKPDSAVWVTNNHTNPSPKGLAVLTFNGFKIEELDRDSDMEIFIPLRVSKKTFHFNLLAFWNFYSACKQGRFKGVNGAESLELSAIVHYKHLFKDPSLMVGDLNFGPTFCQQEFVELSEILGKSGMQSLYHKYENLPLSESKHSSFKSTRKKLHHIDHMFGSEFFSKNMCNYKIENIHEVVLSDHSPITLDINV